MAGTIAARMPDNRHQEEGGKVIMLNERLISAVPVVLLHLLLIGCKQMNTEPLSTSTPLVVCIGYDITESTRHLPILTTERLDDVISVVKRHGGIVAFGLIADKTESLTRLELAPVTGQLDERARSAERNRRAVGEWKQRVASKIARPRDVRITEFNNFVRQMDTLFRERTIPKTVLKIALLVTDAVDTSKHRRASVSLAGDVTVLAVGVERLLGEKLFGDRVHFFEDVDSAIKMLRTVAVAQRREG